MPQKGMAQRGASSRLWPRCAPGRVAAGPRPGRDGPQPRPGHDPGRHHPSCDPAWWPGCCRRCGGASRRPSCSSTRRPLAGRRCRRPARLLAQLGVPAMSSQGDAFQADREAPADRTARIRICRHRPGHSRGAVGRNALGAGVAAERIRPREGGSFYDGPGSACLSRGRFDAGDRGIGAERLLLLTSWRFGRPGPGPHAAAGRQGGTGCRPAGRGVDRRRPGRAIATLSLLWREVET